MQVMFRIFGLFLIIFTSLTSASAAPRPLEKALDAVQQQNWQAALQIAAQDGRIATDIIEWHLHRSGAGTAQAVSRFMARNGDWPGLPYLQKQSEDSRFVREWTNLQSSISRMPDSTTTQLGIRDASVRCMDGASSKM